MLTTTAVLEKCYANMQSSISLRSSGIRNDHQLLDKDQRGGIRHLRLLSIHENVAGSVTSQSLTENSTSTRSASLGTKSCTHWDVKDDVVADTAAFLNCNHRRTPKVKSDVEITHHMAMQS